MTPTELTKAALTAWETRDVGAAARLQADDFELTGPAPVALNREAYLGFQAIHNEGFPDWKFNPTQFEENGDTVKVTYQITATHTGPWDVSKLGVPIPAVQPTGKHRAWPVEHMEVTVKADKISKLYVENTAEGGVAGTLQWLGINIAAPSL
jgi:hypothetical protein